MMKEDLAVLIIEDNEGDAFLIKELLSNDQRYQYIFSRASTLRDAQKLLASHIFDIVFVDLGLPDSSGIETLEALSTTFPHFPFVVLTGNEDEAIGIASVKAGAEDYILKGHLSSALLSRVCRYAVERFQSKIQLVHSEKLLRSTLDALSAHIAIVNKSGTIVEVNRAWKDFAKSNSTSLVGLCEGANYFEACRAASPGKDEDIAIKFLEGIEAVLSGEKTYFEMEYPCVGPKDTYWFHGRVTAFKDQDVTNVVIAHEDITARKSAVSALQENEELLRHVFDNSPNCVFIKDDDGRYISANKTLSSYFGLPVDQIVGKTDLEIANHSHFAREEAEKFMQFDKEVLTELKSRTIRDERMTRPSGDVRWMQTTKVPLKLPSSSCVLGISVDMTEQRLAENRIRQSEERLRTILNNLTSNVVLLSPDLNVLWANEAALDESGHDLGTIHGHECYKVHFENEKICDECPVKKALISKKVEEKVFKTEEGRTWRVMGCPVFNEKGNIESVVELSEDITDFLTTKEMLMQSQKMESLGTLAGGVAHDFNNILTAILGFAELCRNRFQKNEEIYGDLNEIYSAGLRAKDLVKQILTFSRRAEVEPAPLYVTVIAKEALKLLRSTLPASISFKTRIHDIEKAVLADPTHIHQIIMNVCTNAAHAMEPDGGTLTVEITEVQPDTAFFTQYPDLVKTDYVELAISDTGSGIASDILPHIFEPYFTTKEKGEGTGLGLAVTHGIVKQCGGEIAVESQPGVGTQFRIYIPCVEDKLQPQTEQGGQHESYSTDGKHVLLVDDEAQIVKLLGRFLTKFGCKVSAFENSLEALKAFYAAPQDFDLIISDVTMPHMRGDQLAEKVLENYPDFPILLMTGYSKGITEKEVIEKGIKGLITKPVSPAVLMFQLKQLFSGDV